MTTKQTAEAWVISPFPVSFLKGLVTKTLPRAAPSNTNTPSLSQQAFKNWTGLFEPKFCTETLHAISLLSVQMLSTCDCACLLLERKK